MLVATSLAGFAELPVDAADASAEHRLTLQALGSVTGRLAALGYDKVGQEIHMQSAAQGNGGGLNFGWGVSKVTTDAEGRYQFKTIKPPPYPVTPTRTRPAHIHFDVRGRHDELITQMYFEGDPYHKTDAFLQSAPNPEALIVKLSPPSPEEPDFMVAEFDIVFRG